MTVELAFAEQGAGPPVLILHGLFGSGMNWTTIARRLAERHRVLALDLRNHGASGWADHMGYRAMADDVAAFMAAHGLARAAFIGHSMGGKVAMTLALTRPALVDRLVVVDIAPTGHAPTLVGYVEAMRNLDLRGVTRRSAADAALRAAIANAAERSFLLQNLVSSPEGLRWRINLQAIHDDIAALSDFPDFPPGTEFSGPTLVVRGARSTYVQERDLPVFARFFPRYRLVTVAEAGHWVHAERPADFLAAVAPFLAGA